MRLYVSASGQAPTATPETYTKPETIPVFQATCSEHLQQAMPATNTRSVRVFSQNDSRFGFLTVRRRRFTAAGVQPAVVVPHVLEWFFVDGAVAPTTSPI